MTSERGSLSRHQIPARLTPGSSPQILRRSQKVLAQLGILMAFQFLGEVSVTSITDRFFVSG
jgi:hypothetical protein